MRRTFTLIVFFVAGILIGIGLTIWMNGGNSGQSEASIAVHQQESEAEAHDHDHAQVEEVSADDWCGEHQVPESKCTICNPELIEKFKAADDWCGEHGLPESACWKCNPALTFKVEGDEPVMAEPVKSSVFFPPNERGCQSENSVIRFLSESTADRIGLKVAPVVASELGEGIEAPAEIVFDETKTLAITIPISATVTRWLVEPGRMVSSGDPLAELQSPEMAELKAEFLEALADWGIDSKQLERAIEMKNKNLISQSEFQEVEAHEKTSWSKLNGLSGKLGLAGMSASDLQALKRGEDVDASWVFGASQSGTILERRAPLGELLEAGTTLALMGNPEALWIEAHVRDTDLSHFRVDQRVQFAVDGNGMSQVQGRIIWVSQYLEPQTRTGLVRARIIGESNDLRAHIFGRMQLAQSNTENGLLVPKDAVQWEGCCNVVFVQEAVNRYKTTKVGLERGNSEYYIAKSGVEPGQLVVTDGSFLLKTELKKESLGAGCAGE